MTITARIKQNVEENFQPVHYELVNESHKHAGHAGDNGTGESHFQLLIVSPLFEGCNRMQRHRMVYAKFGSLFSQGLHALSLDLRAPEEYIKPITCTQ